MSVTNVILSCEIFSVSLLIICATVFIDGFINMVDRKSFILAAVVCILLSLLELLLLMVIYFMNVFKDLTHRPADTNEVAKTVVNRHILLIRHGQYFKGGKVDEEKKLTNIGMRQADLTGQHLAELGPKVKIILNFVK